MKHCLTHLVDTRRVPKEPFGYTFLLSRPFLLPRHGDLHVSFTVLDVPATISELENWRELTKFMAQWFHVHFFELPGHGESSPFDGKFSSQKVAELVEQLVDELGFERFNLMGFSFGGILAMRTFKHLSRRIDRLIISPPA